jgi:calcineurin-like phosphoesterase family protein
MTKDIWIISDTHYNQSDILTFHDFNGNRVRDFIDVDEMNEHIIDKWNSVVKPTDIVYHLGDVFYDRTLEDRQKFETDWRRFNGHKRLIFGNHDDIRYLSGKDSEGRWLFEKVLYWRKYPEFGLIMTHAPIHDSGLYSSTDFSKQLLNVHGHIHTNPSPPGPYRCVCVEQVNYTPVNIEELRTV